MTFFKKLSVNIHGRDFVVGDIHGCFTMLEQAMRRADFDEATDRIISVGDLVDRGPESIRCLEFLAKPWFHAICGNHDQSLLDYARARSEGTWNSLDEFYKNLPYEGYDDSEAAVKRWGSQWQREIPLETLFEIADAIRELPLAIEIETQVGLIGFVHADVPNGMDWKKFKDRLNHGRPDIVDDALWSRKRHKHNDNSGVAGLHRLYVGHTVVERVKFLGNVCFVDTGASIAEGSYKDYFHITLAEITAPELKFAQMPDKNFNIVLAADAPSLLPRLSLMKEDLG